MKGITEYAELKQPLFGIQLSHKLGVPALLS